MNRYYRNWISFILAVIMLLVSVSTVFATDEIKIEDGKGYRWDGENWVPDAEYDVEKPFGLRVDEKGDNTDIHIEGEVSIKDYYSEDCWDTTAVAICTYEDGNIIAEMDGNITADDKRPTGLYIDVKTGDVSMDYTGDVAIVNGEYASGISVAVNDIDVFNVAENVPAYFSEEGGSAELTVTGNTSVSSAYDAMAVVVDTQGEKTSANVTIVGNITAVVTESSYIDEYMGEEMTTDATALMVRNGGGSNDVHVTGNNTDLARKLCD